MKKKLTDMPQCEPIMDGIWERMVLGTMPLPSPNESKIRPIKIKQLDNGYVIQVGCKKIAISKQKDLIRLLTQYIENPNETEQKYNDGKLIKL